MNGLGIEFLKCPVSWTIFLFHVVAEPDLKLITAMEEKWVSCLNFGYKDWKIQIFLRSFQPLNGLWAASDFDLST